MKAILTKSALQFYEGDKSEYNALLKSSAKEVVDFNNVLKKLISSNERI